MRIALAWLDLADPTDRVIARSLAVELRRRGHAVCLVGPRRRRAEAARGMSGGFPVYRVGPGEGPAVRQLRGIHAREGVDVWHCHAFGRSHRAFTEAARLGRWPLVVSLHLVLKDYLAFLGGVRGLRGLIAGSSHVALPNEAARAEFLRLCPEWRRRSSAVYYGTPAPADAARPRRAKPYVLSVARLAPYKGQDLLLMAFAKVLDEKPGLRLVLCGRDQLGGALKVFARTLGLDGRVAFTGEASRARVQALLKGCDFVVLPSRRENFPLAALEAMAAGKALVASATGGLPELVRHGVDGLLVPPNDADALAARMLELAGDPALRRRLGRAARRRSGAFTWAAAARLYEALYARAAQSRRSAGGTRSKK